MACTCRDRKQELCSEKPLSLSDVDRRAQLEGVSEPKRGSLSLDEESELRHKSTKVPLLALCVCVRVTFSTVIVSRSKRHFA